jgi:hypothetical protein
VGSNVTNINFFAAGTTRPATVTGFGAVFSDVDSATATTIEFFGLGDAWLGSYAVPAANNGLSFLGVSFSSERIARVRITTGSWALGPDDGGAANDAVVMDDFIYSEPQGLAQLFVPLVMR